MFRKKAKSQEQYQTLDSPTSSPELDKSRISIFIKNSVHQEGQKQDQKQESKDESQNSCTAWVKSLFKC